MPLIQSKFDPMEVLVKKIEFTDAETNTLDTAQESYKQEVETKRA